MILVDQSRIRILLDLWTPQQPTASPGSVWKGWPQPKRYRIVTT